MTRSRYCRLPSFAAAYCGSVAVLIVLVTWALADEAFSKLLMSICLRLGLERFGMYLGITSWTRYGWDEIGPRIVLLCILLVLAGAFNVLVFYRLFSGSRQARSLRSLLLSIALFGMWLSLPLSYKEIADAGHRWRVRRILPNLAKDASMLDAAWPQPRPAAGPLGSPTTVAYLPFSGIFVVSSPDDPNFLSKSSPSYPCSFRKQTGPWIWRMDNGGLRFSTIDHDISVEHHPHGGTPKSFNQTYGRLDGSGNRIETDYEYAVVKYEEFEPGWYLVWYSFRLAH